MKRKQEIVIISDESETEDHIPKHSKSTLENQSSSVPSSSAIKEKSTTSVQDKMNQDMPSYWQGKILMTYQTSITKLVVRVVYLTLERIRTSAFIFLLYRR